MSLGTVGSMAPLPVRPSYLRYASGHEAAIANWKNRTLLAGDNPDVMRGMNSESVDWICPDPPFNSNRDCSAPVGSEAAGAAFKDTWTLSDVDLARTNSDE